MQILDEQLLTIFASAIIQFASLVKQLSEQANRFVSLWMSKSASCLELMCQPSGRDNTWRDNKYIAEIYCDGCTPFLFFFLFLQGPELSLWQIKILLAVKTHTHKKTHIHIRDERGSQQNNSL